MVTDVYHIADAGPILSAIVVVVSSLLPVLLAIGAFRRARRRTVLAEAAMRPPDQDLREGEVLLSGIVEHAPGHDVAVRVDVTQHGTEGESSGSWSYSWTEIDREVIVKPFYLRLASGARVRVLAPTNVEVADALDQKVLISNVKRVLSAELIPGEQIHAQGRLERGDTAMPGREAGYRDVEREWQLVPSHGRMLLSSEPLGKGMQERATFHRRYGRRAVVLFVLIQLSFVNFYVRAFGASEPATVVETEWWTQEDSDGEATQQYAVQLRVDDKVEQIRIDGDDYERLHKGDIVAIRRDLIGWDIGDGATLFFVHAVLAPLLAFGLLFTYGGRRASTRPWFRRRVDHSGSGRLPGDAPF